MEQLSALKVRDVDELRAASLRRQAKAELAGAVARRADRDRYGSFVAAGKIYHRGEPVLVAAVVVLYLGWAFIQAMTLFQ